MIEYKKNKGFTLVELMIVVVIIGILAAIAIPNYQRYILRSHRVEARNTLQTVAQRIEQHFKITRQWNRLSTEVGGSRDLTDATLVAWGLSQSPMGGDARYDITFTAAPTENGYTLRAIAVGAQTGDNCSAFFLDQRGVKVATTNGNINAPNPFVGRNDISRECWTR